MNDASVSIAVAPHPELQAWVARVGGESNVRAHFLFFKEAATPEDRATLAECITATQTLDGGGTLFVGYFETGNLGGAYQVFAAVRMHGSPTEAGQFLDRLRGRASA